MTKRIRELIKRYQLVSFFLLTYLFTWGLWIPSTRLYYQKNIAYAGVFVLWGLFGPALAGILITRIINPKHKDERQKIPFLIFFIGLLISAFVLAINNFMESGLNFSIDIAVGLVISGLIMGIPAAIVISSIYSRNHTVRNYLQSLIKPRGKAIYYLIALLLPFFIDWIGMFLSRYFYQSVYYKPPLIIGWDLLGVILIASIYRIFFANILGEEVGWRGFALPRLQARYSPLIASLIIALFWFPWHLPLKWANPDPTSYLFYGLSFIPNSVLLTWLYNRSKGSLWVVGIAHIAINISGKYVIGYTTNGQVVGYIVALVLVVLDRMWKKDSVVDFSVPDRKSA